MIEKLFSTEAKPGAFFRRVDWTAFWTATVVSLLVYFFTLGPSVTLEDCGELAVAGDHLGVPHPPGYPIWTICAFLFARLFSWVTYQGQPTPAWSISLMSGVFAALASGITAMLITRSASDMVKRVHGDGPNAGEALQSALCWAGGVGGSLVFAFSPVMWSQATIVEVYTLNAFFLMWIFLLTYRWMRKPSDGILWLTAFVFGLGLTNYQVLLLAAVPLVVVIFLRNIALFRDFLLVGIPVLLTAHILQIGAELPAEQGMMGPSYAKLASVTKASVPSMGLLVAGAVLVLAAMAFALFVAHRRKAAEAVAAGQKSAKAAPTVLFEKAGFIAAGTAAFGAVLVLFSSAISNVTQIAATDQPLLQPTAYTTIAGLIALVFAAAIGGAYYGKGRWNDRSQLPWLCGAVALALVVFMYVGAQPAAPMPGGYQGLPFGWGLPVAALLGGMVVLFLLGMTIPKGLFYVVPVAVVQISVFMLLRRGAMNGLMHPTSWWFWWPVIWNFVVIGLAWMTLPNGKTVALTTFFAELGTAFYVYMPIVSDLRNPPMNWGYPRTWEGFKHAITRGQYEKIAPSDIFDSKFLFQLGSYFTDLRIQFTLLAATLGFLPFTLWSFRTGTNEPDAAREAAPKRFRALYVAAGLYLAISTLVIISEMMKGEPFLRLDKWLICVIGLLLMVGAGAIACQQIVAFVRRMWQNRSLSEGVTVGLCITGGAMVVCLFLTKGLMHFLSNGAEDPSMGVKLASLLLAVVIVTALCAGWFFAQRFAEKRCDFKMDMDEVTQQWLIATAAGFLVMSVLLVALANIKGDLQDAFIQKVKFISSHGIFALWIGYGLCFGLVIGNRVLAWFVKKGWVPEALQKPLRGLLMLAAIGAAIIPIHENYRNEWLVFAMSGAEQNGHDFGWQFGNYQLRGANAINEELDADEEPMPNPTFPPEMGTNAIFFGGTDPGRFVPTYMIYSADVRPDVFLITQNALADNTYMSTMRDLYGNDIWIPSPDDSAKAFQVYVDEVQSGKRQKNAALTIENGRVQVSGALGVMEINGILCDMIFKKNKMRHEFYVEESYVIQWMYSYLTPHGLIMKINSEQCPITRQNTNDDMDFWDWYTRRLLRNPMFRRDLPAQKSFSKLRSAIAGLYSARGMRREAERAFQEACALYPISPESNFRLIQEVLLTQGRYAEALDILQVYDKKDPNNDRGKDFEKFVRDMQTTQETIRTLTNKVQAGKPLSFKETFDLARAYQRLGQNEAASRCLKQLSDMEGLPPQTYYELALVQASLKKPQDAAAAMDKALVGGIDNSMTAEQLMEIIRIYGEVREMEKMAAPLSRYLQLRPKDWQEWLNMAILSAARRQNAQTQYALQSAMRYGGNQALKAISEHPVLRQIAEPMLRQMQQGTSVDGMLGPRQ